MKLDRLVLVLVLVLVLDGCKSTEPTSEKEARDRADGLAQAFYRYVDVYYGTRLAAEKNDRAPPPPATKLRAREDLVQALHAIGVDLPDAPDDKHALKAAVAAVRETLTQHDYVFLPLGQGADAEDDDMGIALARVRERDPARSLDLWGRKVEYKRILFEAFIRDYPSWKARALHEPGPSYPLGRFSGATVYIDHEELVRRAQTLKPPYDALGLPGMIREVELRTVANLCFMRDVTRAATTDPAERQQALVRVYERVFWTVLRYGDPDVALAEVTDFASGSTAPPAMRDAAARVLAQIPPATRELPSKAKRAEALHTVADEVWPTLPGRS